MSRTVLIVDDSLTVRMDLAEAFTAAGFGVHLSESAADARVALARVRPDVVVLDRLLPDADGIELLEEIRASSSAATVVLMLSSEAEVADRIRGLRTGADEYVGKPYDTHYVIARAQELLQHRSTPTAGKTKALVIDDSPTFRTHVAEALERAGYAVVSAASGEEGLRVAAASRPDAILVDGVLPGMDGATVIRHVRLDAALRDTPCVLMTASDERDAELRALDAGADNFVRKEDHIDVVLAKVAAVLRRGSGFRDRADTRSLQGPKKVLAVDDSQTYVQVVAATLKGEGYDVIMASSGEQALELLAVQPVDCILLDLLMPGIGGHETCRRIKGAPVMRDIPLIMLTAVEDRDAMVEGLGAGADDYVSKASELPVLMARVRAQIRRKQFEDENRHIREDLLRAKIDAAETRAARELAATRARLVEQLERANRELEAFSYSVSHDLRAPLRSIDGFSQALAEDCTDRLDARGLDYLRRIRTAAQHMGELIDDLLQLSRVGRAELSCAEADLSEIARTIVSELRRREPEREVEVAIEEAMTATGDARLIRVVLDNLLGNAWKFTRRTAAAHVQFARDPEAGEDVFVVRDNGAGFDMTYADKLFRPFQRLHADPEFPGTGIGLATVSRIVERHGGRVWAEGAPGRGAAFRFTLVASAGRGLL